MSDFHSSKNSAQCFTLYVMQLTSKTRGK